MRDPTYAGILTEFVTDPISEGYPDRFKFQSAAGTPARQCTLEGTPSRSVFKHSFTKTSQRKYYTALLFYLTHIVGRFPSLFEWVTK
jgi:hypothetical protein